MKASEMFRTAVDRQLAPWLKERGFSRERMRFVRWTDDEVCQLIDVQASKWSASSEYEFTINLGILSAKVFRFFVDRAPPRFPESSQCHWWVRLGELASQKVDWWRIRTDENGAARVMKEVTGLLQEAGLPLLTRMGSETGLRSFWSHPSHPRYASLIALAVESGLPEEASRLIEQYRERTRGSPEEEVAMEVIAKASSRHRASPSGSAGPH